MMRFADKYVVSKSSERKGEESTKNKEKVGGEGNIEAFYVLQVRHI